MKTILFMMPLVIGLMSCGKKVENTALVTDQTTDHTEVIYFHGKQRCATCMAIEKNTKEVVETMFADEVKDGKVVFLTVDFSTSDGERFADKYEVTWSSLFVNVWKDGKETCNNMTEFGFENARNNPDEFKKGLAEKIRQSLK